MSHSLSLEDQSIVQILAPVYNWSMKAFNSATMAWFGTGERLSSDGDSQVAPYGIRLDLYRHWSQLYQSECSKTLESSRSLSFYNICNSYRDILCQSRSQESSFMDSYLIHLLNHSLKSIDQGFTRPKILILVPSAMDAHLLVRRLFLLYPSGDMANAVGLEKFNSRIVEVVENDEFIISLKLERNIRIYGSYSNSDIILASPLGLVTKIWLEEKTKSRNLDSYLSSIEMLLVVDCSHRKEFKNWFYVPKIVEYLNCMPEMKAPHITPLRRCHVDGKARFYRQTIVLSSYLCRDTKDIKDMFHRLCVNFEGKLHLSYPCLTPRGIPFISPSLPFGDCILALSYPPGNKLKSFIEKSKVEDFFIPKDFPKGFSVHGGWEVKVSVKKLNKAKLKLTPDWKRLLGLCMPQVPQRIAIKNMTDELRRHGKHIDFLNEDNYVQFVVSVFMRYRFDLMMNFVCERIRERIAADDDNIEVSTIKFLRRDWTGIRLADLTEALREYGPASHAELITKLFYYESRFFLYEISTYVTRDGKLAQRRGEAVRATNFDDPKTTVVANPESFIYIIALE